MRLNPHQYRRVVFLAGVSLAVIVATGAAVRLTEAGLGCETWPACSEDRIVPELALHPWIEFGNRLLSGVVAVAVISAALLAYRRVPRRNDLVIWAWGLVAGVAGQIVLGGITVRVDLHPLFVGAHFLLSMVLLWNAVVLFVKASNGPSRPVPAVDRRTILLGRLVMALAIVVLTVGTLVTGTGPHSGDSRADRLDIDLVAITRVHAILVWLLVAATVVLALKLYRSPGPAQSATRWLLLAMVIQGLIGYIQYGTGVPAGLVEAHIIGATIVWSAVVYVVLALYQRAPLEAASDSDTWQPRARSGTSGPETGAKEVIAGSDLARMDP